MLDTRAIINELFTRNGLKSEVTVGGAPVYTIPGQGEYIFAQTQGTVVRLGIYYKTGKKMAANAVEVRPKFMSNIDLCDPNSIKDICDWVKYYAHITIDPDK
jgi:hypothetical protein